MQQGAEWRETFLRYRLNELGDAERQELDFLLLTNDDCSASMQDAEYDLRDALAAGELRGDEARRAQQALGTVPSPVAAPGPVPASREVRWPARLFAWRQSTGWALAAAVLLLTATALLYRRIHTRPSSQPAPQTANTLPAAPRPEVARTASPDRAPSAPARAQSSPAARPSMQAVATVLLPSTLRSQGTLSVGVARGEKTVRFLWQGARERAGRYELQLVDDGGAQMCRAGGHAFPEKSSAGPLAFDCSADDLLPGAGFLRLFKTPVDADSVPVTELAITVEKR